jgi:outer membrane protein TolC
MHTALLIAALAAARPVSLAEAVQLAASQNPDAAAARAQAVAADAVVEHADSAWLPELTANGTYDHTTAPQTLDYGQFVGLVGGVYGLQPKNPGVIPAPLSLQARNGVYGTLQISQPFFSPQGLFGIQPAKLAAQAAALSADEAKEQVALGAAKAYLGLQGIAGLTAAARDALAVAKKREADATSEIAAGASTKIALLRAQTETAQAERQLAQLEAARSGGEALLAALCGEPLVPLTGATASLAFTPGVADASPWTETFATKAAKAQVEAAEAALRANQWGFLPTVAGVARGSYTSAEGFYGTNTYGDLIVAVSVPLYDRGVRYAAIHEDRAHLLAARSHLLSIEAQGEATWRAAIANLQAAQADLMLAESQAQLAKEAQAEVDQLQKNGLATNLELSDADSQRFQAESAAAQAKAALEVRRAELAAAEGRLIPTAVATK